MAKTVFPRSQASHELVANEILARHEKTTGKTISLPVPIDAIVEVTYGLQIVHDRIDETDGTIILGALTPVDRTITLNEKHEDLFESVMGPERFTVAHELSHWIYDAENPDQLTLDFDREDVFCYHRESASALSESTRLREMNANKLAAAILLPEHLMRALDIDDVVSRSRFHASEWGVSRKTLGIRLDQLKLVDDEDVAKLDL